MNNTRTGNPSVSSSRRSVFERMTHRMTLFRTKYTRSALDVSIRDCCRQSSTYPILSANGFQLYIPTTYMNYGPRCNANQSADQRKGRIFFEATNIQEVLGVELGFPWRPRETWGEREYVMIVFYTEVEGVCRILTLAASGDRESRRSLEDTSRGRRTSDPNSGHSGAWPMA